jgi:cardiolipin synthase
MEQNFEVEAFIYDSEITGKAIDIFVEDQKSTELQNLKDWIKRPVTKRFIESFLRLFAPLL